MSNNPFNNVSVYTYGSEVLRDMRDWLIECYPSQEDEINHAAENRILKAIESKFDGGIKEFMNSYNPVAK